MHIKEIRWHAKEGVKEEFSQFRLSKTALISFSVHVPP